MITIQGKKRPISIPSSWEELAPWQYVFTITKLLQLISRQLSLFDFRIALMLCYTGYRPKQFRIFPISPEEQEIIHFNLVRISEQITFPLRKKNESLEINNLFLKNPIPFVRIRRKKYRGKRFDVGVVIRTDITAKNFSDALDTAKAFAETQSEECLNTLCAILYPKHEDHARNMLSDHHKKFSRVGYDVRFGILIWFTGIVEYFSTHPDYKILFQNNTESEDKITLGMSETIMHLVLVGFGSKQEMENTNVVDYFDLQIKSLKQTIAEARGNGAKTEDIAKHTRMSYSLIEKLS